MRVARLLSTGLLAALTGCSAVRQLPNGAYRVQCQDHLDECRQEARNHCLGRGGVEEVSSRELDKLYGTEGHERGVLVSEVVFYCGDNAPRPPIPLPPRPSATASAVSDASAGPSVDPGLIAPATPAPAGWRKRICIPGSTQTCVGPGACVGGQVCEADGLAWGPCDCGPAPAGTTAPATLGAPAAASAPAPAAPPPGAQPSPTVNSSE